MKKEAKSISEMVISGEVVHDWIIESPNGPTSKGLCLMHNHTRIFKNFLTDDPWKDPISNKGSYETRQKVRMVNTEYVAPLNNIDW